VRTASGCIAKIPATHAHQMERVRRRARGMPTLGAIGVPVSASGLCAASRNEHRQTADYSPVERKNAQAI
jgi:hypothetical protein